MGSAEKCAEQLAIGWYACETSICINAPIHSCHSVKLKDFSQHLWPIQCCCYNYSLIQTVHTFRPNPLLLSTYLNAPNTIECYSYTEFIAGNHREQKLCIHNLSRNFTEVIMNANKVVHEKLFAVH